MSGDSSTAVLRRTSEGLASLRRSRTAAGWERAAYEAVKDDGPLEEVEHRMTVHLHELAERAGQSRQLREAARELRAKPALPRDAIRRNEELARNG